MARGDGAKLDERLVQRQEVGRVPALLGGELI